MNTYYPSYYKKFACKAGRCNHNCCIGWEVDIDSNTYKKYSTMPTDLGEKIRASLSCSDGVVSFKMKEGERCPFLNCSGLCDIILEAGEEYISDVCRLHPRFRNLFSDRVEIGLGLACEEAARIILSEKTRFSLEPIVGSFSSELNPWERELFEKRYFLINVVTDRNITVDDRIERLTELCSAEPAFRSLSDWCSIFLELDYMDESFPNLLHSISASGFDEKTKTPEYLSIPLEQLAAYFIFRHISASEDENDLYARLGFCLISLRMIRAASMIIASKNGICTEADIIELARLYSSEIEYSEENTEIIIGEFAEF